MNNKNGFVPIVTGTQVQVEAKKVPGRFSTVLIGIEHGKFLIFKVPSFATTDMKTLFSPGKVIIVRYIHQGTIMGFSATVLGIVLQPTKLLLTTYPINFENHNLRRSPRIQCHLPAELSTGKKKIAGFVQDISKNGCCFLYKTRKYSGFDTNELNSMVLLQLKIPGVGGKLEIYASVRNTKTDDKIGQFGLEFVDIGKEIEDQLSLYIDSVLEEILEA